MEIYEKKYKDAIERAKKWYNAPNADKIPIYANRILAEIFPELAESEDEKILKALIRFHKSTIDIDGIKGEDIIAWLEKQNKQQSTLPKWRYKNDNTPLLRDSLILNKYGCVAKSPSGALVSNVWVIDYDELAKLPKEEFENLGKQKSVDEDESKYELSDLLVQGDWIVRNLEAYKNTSKDKYDVWCVNCILDNGYYICDDLNGNRETFTLGEVNECFSLWDMSYAKPGDILAIDKSSYQYSFVAIYKEQNKECSNAFDAYCFVTHSGQFCTINPSSKGFYCSKDLHPATKKERELLFSKMANAGYVWDSENRQLKSEF